jgi:hypothetical protein
LPKAINEFLFKGEMLCLEQIKDYKLKLILFSLIFGLATIEVSADVINVVINSHHEMIQKQAIRRLLYYFGIPIEIIMFVTNVLVYKKTGIILF